MNEHARRSASERAQMDAATPLLRERERATGASNTRATFLRFAAPIALGLISAACLTLEPVGLGRRLADRPTIRFADAPSAARTARLGDDGAHWGVTSDGSTRVDTRDKPGDGASSGGDGAGLHEAARSGMFYDMALAMECAADCVKTKPRVHMCPFANANPENTLMACFRAKCGCREATLLSEALLYICDGDELQDSKKFSESQEYSEFFSGTVDAIEAHCEKEEILKIVMGKADTSVTEGFCLPIGANGEVTLDAPPNCLVQQEVAASCEYKAAVCGVHSTRVGPFGVSTVTTAKTWSCPSYSCADGSCSWDPSTQRVSQVKSYTAPCRYETTVATTCKVCDTGYDLDAATNRCDKCTTGYIMSKGKCVAGDMLDVGEAKVALMDLLNDPKMQELLEITPTDVQGLQAGVNLDAGDFEFAELGKALRLLHDAHKAAELGAFWDDWANELNRLRNVLQSYITAVSNFVNGIVGKLEDGTRAVTALSQDLSALASKCANVITDSLETILPTSSAISNAVSGAFSCGSGTAAALGSRGHLLHPDNRHILDQRITAIFHGEAAAAKIQPTPKTEVAALGACPVSPLCQPEICYSKDMEDLGIKPSYELPWPQNGKMAKFKPDSMTLGIEGGFDTCVSVKNFNIDPTFAVKVATAFVNAIKPPFEQVINEITGWANGLTDGVKSASSSVKSAFDTVGKTVKSIDVSGRRLLSEDEERAYDFEMSPEYNSARSAGRLAGEYLHISEQMELRTRQVIEDMRALVTTSPMLGGFHHKSAVASLGGGLLNMNDIVQSLTSTFTGISNSINFDIALKTAVQAKLSFSVSKKEFRSGDFAENLKLSQSIQKVVTYGPIVTIISGELVVEIPYYLIADGLGEFAYEVQSHDFEITFGWRDNKPTFGINNKAGFTFTSTGGASISLGLKTGVVASLVDFKIDMCLIGMLCAGPKVNIVQPVFFGADAYAAVALANTQVFNGKMTLSPAFGDSFSQYPDLQLKCPLREGAAVVGAGTYVEFPKIELDALIEFTILGDNKCAAPVQLYTAPAGVWRQPESVHSCTSTNSAGKKMVGTVSGLQGCAVTDDLGLAKKTFEECRDYAAQLRYRAFGYRMDNHPTPAYRNTCFFCATGIAGVDNVDSVHLTACTNPKASPQNGCVVG